MEHMHTHRHMSHFRIDMVKYHRHLEIRARHFAAAERLLGTIGSVPWVRRAIEERAASGRLSFHDAKYVEEQLVFVAEWSCPATLDRPEPVAEPDEHALAELLEHLLQCFEVMRFSNFVIPPGGVGET